MSAEVQGPDGGATVVCREMYIATDRLDFDRMNDELNSDTISSAVASSSELPTRDEYRDNWL